MKTMSKEEIITILSRFAGCDHCTAYHACHGLDGSVSDKTQCKRWVAYQSAVLAVKEHKGKIIVGGDNHEAD